MDSPKTILVVDDEPAILTLITDALERYGYQVLVAQGGAEALQLLDSHPAPIDLLLTDITMPGMDGVALSEQVKRNHPSVHIAFMSGAADPELIRRARPLFFKPFKMDVLAKRLHSLLEDVAQEKSSPKTPIVTQIFPDKGLAIHRAKGKLQQGDMKAAMVRLFENPEFTPGMNILWDFAEADFCNFDTLDVRRLASSFTSLFERRGAGNLALVVPRVRQVVFSRTFEIITQTLPFDLRLFRTIDEAAAWLGEDVSGAISDEDQQRSYPACPETALEDFDFSILSDDRALYVRALGEINLRNCDGVYAALEPVSEATQDHIYVSLRDLRSIDSAGLGMLIRLNSRMRRGDKNWSLLHLNSPIAKLFHLSKVDQVIKVHSEPDAGRIAQMFESDPPKPASPAAPLA